MTVKTDHGKSQRKGATDLDNSLQGAAVRRATERALPKTLTPYEWQQWYAENGVPPEHRNSESRLKRNWVLLKGSLFGIFGTKPGQ